MAFHLANQKYTETIHVPGETYLLLLGKGINIFKVLKRIN